MDPKSTILIVDDDRFVRTSVRGTLQEEPDLLVTEATDGDEALQSVIADHPAVVLLDLLMPRRSGLEVLSEIRKASPQSKIIVMTSLQTASMEDLARSSGAVGFLAKPFHPLELLAEIRRALEA
jgi:two-component system, chemotaxis family, chemotaxis protein CheY